MDNFKFMGSWPAWVRWVAVLPTTALGLGMAAGMASGPNEPSHAIMLNPTSPCYQDVERDMESITGAKPLTLEWSGGDTYYGSFAAGKMELIYGPYPPQGTVVCHAGLWFINYFWLDRAHPIYMVPPRAAIRKIEIQKSNAGSEVVVIDGRGKQARWTLGGVIRNISVSEGDATISFKSGYAVVIDGIHGHYLFVITDTASGPALTRQFNGGDLPPDFFKRIEDYVKSSPT